MSQQSINVKPETLLAAIHEHVSALFFAATKSDAKQAYNDLRAGKHLPLLEISSPEHGDVIGVLALDFSEFAGKLNFRAFRDALASQLNRIAEKLRNEDDLNILSSEETGAMLFHIPGLVQVDDQINVLVTGIEQSKAGEIMIKLMFIDPDNYRKQ